MSAMSNGRPRNPGQMICPLTGRRCPHEEPPPPCRHVLDYADPEQDDVQMIGLMLDQQAQRNRRLDAAADLLALAGRPSVQDLLRHPAAAACAAIEPAPPRAIEAAQEPLYGLPPQRRAQRGK